jgi:molybdopterin synthase catalytic subunit
MMARKMENIFYSGAIPASLIAQSIQKHHSRLVIGGHSIFLGQVRADEMDGNAIVAIEYSTYQEMAMEKMQGIREAIFGKYALSCMHVYHSLGRVEAGEICFFVFASAPHRQDAIHACEETVERIKTELPIWGKEIFADQTHRWKVNK